MSTNYQITATPKNGYLHFQVSGNNSAQNVVGYLNEINEQCAAQKVSTVLIEENLRGPGLNMFDVFKVVKEILTRPQHQLNRIVYVDVNPTHDPAMMAFAKDLAFNRGLRVHICRTVKEAEEWLAMMTR